MEKPKTMKVEVVGDVSEGVGPKDIILGIIRKLVLVVELDMLLNMLEMLLKI